MALVQTDGAQEAFAINNTDQLIRILSCALADELSARNLYARIVDSLAVMGTLLPGDVRHMVKERLEEIEKDEMQHQGALISIISQLSPYYGSALRDGAEGA
jgi:rubrerythrin